MTAALRSTGPRARGASGDTEIGVGLLAKGIGYDVKSAGKNVDTITVVLFVMLKLADSTRSVSGSLLRCPILR